MSVRDGSGRRHLSDWFRRELIRCAFCHPGRLHAGGQSASLRAGAAPEAGGPQPGHALLPGPADPPRGVPNLRPHRGHRRRAHSHVAG